jgi:hypothetical protein
MTMMGYMEDLQTRMLKQILQIQTINIKITLNHYKTMVSQLKFSPTLTATVIMLKPTVLKLQQQHILPGEAVAQTFL